MPFTKVTKTRSICINGDWDSVHYEFTLNEGQPLSEAENLLTEAIDKWENETRAKRLSVFENLPTQTIEPQPPKNTEERLIQDIKTCKDLKVLESYKLLSIKYPNVKAAYEEKYFELSK